MWANELSVWHIGESASSMYWAMGQDSRACEKTGRAVMTIRPFSLTRLNHTPHTQYDDAHVTKARGWSDSAHNTMILCRPPEFGFSVRVTHTSVWTPFSLYVSSLSLTYIATSPLCLTNTARLLAYGSRRCHHARNLGLEHSGCWSAPVFLRLYSLDALLDSCLFLGCCCRACRENSLEPCHAVVFRVGVRIFMRSLLLLRRAPFLLDTVLFRVVVTSLA